MTESTRGCGCCDGLTASTPRPVEQRHGLPAIGYRVGTHADFLASLVAALSDADLPALARLRSRDPRDFTMALLDGAATLCDVLTFYTERLAQESYLRTAVDRTSLQELGRLVAYRLRPGVASATHLAFFVQPPPAVPAATGAPDEAFAAGPYLADGVELPAGLPVRSVPGPGEQPQTFETSETITAKPGWNALRPVPTRPTVLGTGTGVGKTAAYFAGTGHNLRPGDGLLFAPHSGVGPKWTTATVSTVELQAAEGRTYVTWRPALSPTLLPANPHVYVFRRRLSAFGHNAPPRSLFPPGSGEWEWDLSPAAAAADLDGSHPDILVGSWLAIAAPGKTPLLVTVGGVVETSRSAYNISGRVTRVFVNNSLTTYQDQVRQAVIHAVAEELPLANEPDPSAVAGDEIVVVGRVTDLPAGRTVLISGLTGELERRSELATVESTAFVGAGTRLRLRDSLVGGYRRETVVVYGNVTAATHGETVHQILGSGDGSATHQRFELKHRPLTQVPSDEPAGATSTLRVRVNDVEWHEVPTLYQAGPGERGFVTRDTEKGVVVAAFGDGTRGARLPTGQHNVRAEYRRGIGAAGNLPAGAISQVMDPPLGLTKVTNPEPAVGGADPEPASAARQAIPLPVRTLGRAVSLVDYADYARAFAGIAKADATVLSLAGGRTIVVTVAAADGTTVPADTLARLVSSLRTYGDPMVSVVGLPHRAASFRLAVRFKRDPDHRATVVAAAIRAWLAQAFAFAAREFGQPVHRSEVLAAVHRVPGVVAVDLDKLYRVAPPTPAEPGWPAADPDQLASRLLAARPRATSAGAPLAAELLAIADGDPFDTLEEMP